MYRRGQPMLDAAERKYADLDGNPQLALLLRHQLLIERVAHGDDRAHVAQEYSRLTNVRVVENAEFVDLMHRRLDQIDERLEQIDQEVATVVAAGDKHSIAEAPTVVDLKLRGLAAS